MIMTANDWYVYNTTTDCHMCEVLGDDMVRDHCHITGKFRGAAHKVCNLQLRISAWGDT